MDESTSPALGRDQKGKFAPGVSGNPRGKKKLDNGTLVALREKLAGGTEAVIAMLFRRAIQGDVRAATVLLAKVLPDLRTVDTAVYMRLPGSHSERADAIVQAIGKGKLTPIQGGELLAAIASAARIEEVDALRRRIEELERLAGGDGG